MVRTVGFRLLVFAVFGSAILASASARAEDYVPGEVIVKLKNKPNTPGAQRFFGKATSMKGLALRRSWSGINMHKFSVKSDAPNQDVQALIKDLQTDPEVQFAEPNYYVRRQSTGVERVLSEDEFQTMGTTQGAYSQSGAPIDAEQAWAVVSGSASAVVVAVIDTGVDYNHNVFVNSGAIWTNPYEVAGNNIDDDGNGYVDDVRGWNFVSNTNSPMDDDGHGTHVSGIVLGVTQNIQANPIAAAKIRIMPLKFLDANGVGTTSDAIEAIYYAANNGAKVLNNSWGGGGYSQSLVDAINYAYTKKLAFIAAAGNDAKNNDAAPTYPANYSFPNLISIAATSDWDTLAVFSNYGHYTVHIGSPGVSILSTLPNNTYGYANGTSMATPFVSGVAALMLRESPTMNGYQIKNLIMEGSEAISGLSEKVSTASRLNVYNAVTKAQTTTVDSYQPAYDPAVNATRSPATAKMATGCGTVAKAIWDSRNSGGGSGGGPFRQLAFFGLLLVLMMPVLLSVYMRQKAGRNKRVHERYQIDSQVRVRFGDRELVGSVSTISLGGVQLNTDAWLEQGGIVTMQIASPDGKDQIQVEGKVVWCEEQKRYGVAFQNAGETVRASIARWTQSLLKT